jgi:hypothetical protein
LGLGSQTGSISGFRFKVTVTMASYFFQSSAVSTNHWAIESRVHPEIGVDPFSSGA